MTTNDFHKSKKEFELETELKEYKHQANMAVDMLKELGEQFGCDWDQCSVDIPEAFARFQEDARKYYKTDGTFELLDSPEAVVERRKADAGLLSWQAADIAHLKAELERVRGERNELRERVGELAGKFKKLGDSAYVCGINRAKADACLGWEAKVKSGKFGQKEMDAHKVKNEWFGGHQAYADCERIARAALTPAEQGGEADE